MSERKKYNRRWDETDVMNVLSWISGAVLLFIIAYADLGGFD